MIQTSNTPFSNNWDDNFAYQEFGIPFDGVIRTSGIDGTEQMNANIEKLKEDLGYENRGLAAFLAMVDAKNKEVSDFYANTLGPIEAKYRDCTWRGDAFGWYCGGERVGRKAYKQDVLEPRNAAQAKHSALQTEYGNMLKQVDERKAKIKQLTDAIAALSAQMVSQEAALYASKLSPTQRAEYEAKRKASEAAAQASRIDAEARAMATTTNANRNKYIGIAAAATLFLAGITFLVVKVRKGKKVAAIAAGK